MLYIRPLFYITCINLYKQLLDGESVTRLLMRGFSCAEPNTNRFIVGAASIQLQTSLFSCAEPNTNRFDFGRWSGASSNLIYTIKY